MLVGFFTQDQDGAPIDEAAAGFVEIRIGGPGYVVRNPNGSTVKEGVDGYGHPRLKVFDDIWDAYEVAKSLAATECPECDSDAIERVQGGNLECTVCGHGFAQ